MDKVEINKENLRPILNGLFSIEICRLISKNPYPYRKLRRFLNRRLNKNKI